jgi:hypothetical protein
MDDRAQRGKVAIRANPFGTYHGSQVVPPTRGNRQGYEVVILSALQLHSAGPTYNGRLERFEMMVAFFRGDAVPDDVQADLVAFARGPAIIGTVAAQAPQPSRGGRGRSASVSGRRRPPGWPFPWISRPNCCGPMSMRGFAAHAMTEAVALRLRPARFGSTLWADRPSDRSGIGDNCCTGSG